MSNVLKTVRSVPPLLAAVTVLPLLGAGCLSAPPPAPTNWVIACAPGAWTRPALPKVAETARLAAVEVRAPYNGTHLAVLRPDGSVAFDPCNTFAASPSALLRGAIEDNLRDSGLFAEVVGPGSFAASDRSVEVQVTELALDCREEGRRTASVALSLALLKDRRVVAALRGAAKVPAGDDYSAAFSKAVTDAFADAFSRLDKDGKAK